MHKLPGVHVKSHARGQSFVQRLARPHVPLQSASSRQLSAQRERLDLQSRSHSALSWHASVQVAPSAHVSAHALEPPQSSSQGPCMHVKRHSWSPAHVQLGPHSPLVTGGAPPSRAPPSTAGAPPEDPDEPEDPDAPDEPLDPPPVDPEPMSQS